MTTNMMLITIFASALCVFAMRYIPFLLFANRDIPKLVKTLGRILPPALMATLVVYCLKEVSITEAASLVPTAVGILATAVTHLWKSNTILSIAVGTIVYMILLQVF